MFRAALQVVNSDFFHLRLGASVGVISNIYSYSLKVFVALGLPFPQVHLSVATGFQFK